MLRLTWSIPVTLLLAGGCGNVGNSHPDAGMNRTLVLLHTNDEHSHILGDTPELDDYPAPATAGSGALRGGLSRRATVLKQERDAAQAAGQDTLTVSAGDNAVGSLFQVAFARSAPDYTLMKALGYDVTTLGNHELDYGPDGLAAAISAAWTMGGGAPAIVASNMKLPDDPKVAALKALYDDAGTDTNKPLHQSWTLTTPSGLKVGFLGALGADAAYSAPNKAPLTFSLPAGVKETEYAKIEAQAWLDLQAGTDRLRAAGADVVVLLSHAGVDTEDNTKGEDYQIATHVTGIDVIVSGHTHVLYPIQAVTNPTSMKPVYIQQADHYGYALGKIVLSVDVAGKVTVDMAASRVIPIDDTIVGSNPMIDTMISASIRDIESTKLAGGKSFPERSLSAILGSPVADNGSAGNLFFKPVATTAFDLTAYLHLQESAFQVLYADAEMYAGDKYAPPGKLNDVALTAAGLIRADTLAKGKTGTIGFSDLFRVLSLGVSPVDGTIGYPLCRLTVYPAELRGALELTTSYAYSTRNAEGFYFVVSGMKYEYDTTRAPFDFSNPANVFDPNKGRVTKIWRNTDHTQPDTFVATPIYDATNAAWVSGASGGWNPSVISSPYGGSDLFRVITSAYIASYATSQGITLKDDAGAQITLTQSILHRADGSEIKDWEALGELLIKKGGAVPATYNANGAAWVPRRVICDGPLCVH